LARVSACCFTDRAISYHVLVFLGPSTALLHQRRGGNHGRIGPQLVGLESDGSSVNRDIDLGILAGNLGRIILWEMVTIGCVRVGASDSEEIGFEVCHIADNLSYLLSTDEAEDMATLLDVTHILRELVVSLWVLSFFKGRATWSRKCFR
jgi:hypothetical protein